MNAINGRRHDEPRPTMLRKLCGRCGKPFTVHALDVPRPTICKGCETEREPDERDYPPAA